MAPKYLRTRSDSEIRSVKTESRHCCDVSVGLVASQQDVSQWVTRALSCLWLSSVSSFFSLTSTVTHGLFPDLGGLYGLRVHSPAANLPSLSFRRLAVISWRIKENNILTLVISSVVCRGHCKVTSWRDRLVYLSPTPVVKCLVIMNNYLSCSWDGWLLTHWALYREQKCFGSSTGVWDLHCGFVSAVQCK